MRWSREVLALQAARGERQKALVLELLNNGHITVTKEYSERARQFAKVPYVTGYGRTKLPYASWMPLMKRLKALGFSFIYCKGENGSVAIGMVG